MSRKRRFWRKVQLDLALYAGWGTFVFYAIPDLAHSDAWWARPAFLAQAVFWGILFFFRLKDSSRRIALNAQAHRRGAALRVVSEPPA